MHLNLFTTLLKAYRPFEVQGDSGEPSMPCLLQLQKRLKPILAWSGSSIIIAVRRKPLC